MQILPGDNPLPSEILVATYVIQAMVSNGAHAAPSGYSQALIACIWDGTRSLPDATPDAAGNGRSMGACQGNAAPDTINSVGHAPHPGPLGLGPGFGSAAMDKSGQNFVMR